MTVPLALSARFNGVTFLRPDTVGFSGAYTVA
jgi:hypothetical protein